MAYSNLCHALAKDTVASASARQPRAAAQRQPGCNGLVLKAPRYNRSRPTSLAPSVQNTLPSSSLCRAVVEPLATASSSNGASLHHQPQQAPAHVPNLATSAVHAGERGPRPSYADSVTTPVVMTSTYTFKNTAELIEFQEGRMTSFEYGRYGNPTAKACEEKIRVLEGAEECLVSASGMSSVTTMLLALCDPGTTIVTTSDCYWRTRQFMINFLPKLNVTVKVIPPNDLVGLKAALDCGNVSMFFSESPTNPYLRCVDVSAISDLCHAAGAIVCIDGTFSTPINQRALSLGADLVLHSATKYLAGHNDVLAGALAGSKALISKVRTLHHIMGGVIDAHAAYLLLRGLKTLDLRMRCQNESAMIIAKRLEAHPKVDRVYYPGLPSHQDHAIALKQMPGGFGGVVSFEVRGGLWDCAKVIDNVQLPYRAASLGGVESLIEMPAVQSYWGFGPEKRAEIGIKENLIRYSIGVEGVEDIWADLEQALLTVD